MARFRYLAWSLIAVAVLATQAAAYRNEDEESKAPPRKPGIDIFRRRVEPTEGSSQRTRPRIAGGVLSRLFKNRMRKLRPDLYEEEPAASTQEAADGDASEGPVWIDEFAGDQVRDERYFRWSLFGGWPLLGRRYSASGAFHAQIPWYSYPAGQSDMHSYWSFQWESDSPPEPSYPAVSSRSQESRGAAQRSEGDQPNRGPDSRMQ